MRARHRVAIIERMTDSPPAVADAPWFPVARQKLIVMSVATMSMYQIYWFYRNWQLMNARKGSSGSPFWRALAAPITAHGLFADVRADAQARFITVGWSSAGLAAIYFCLTLCCFLDYPWWNIALGSVFALIPVPATLGAVTATLATNGPGTEDYSRMTLAPMCVALPSPTLRPDPPPVAGHTRLW